MKKTRLEPITPLAQRMQLAMFGRERKFSQAEVAAKCGISTPSMVNLLTAATFIRSTNLFDICDYLNIDPRWLATGHGSMERDTRIDKTSRDPLEITCTSAGELRLLTSYRLADTREKIAMDNMATNIVMRASMIRGA